MGSSSSVFGNRLAVCLILSTILLMSVASVSTLQNISLMDSAKDSNTGDNNGLPAPNYEKAPPQYDKLLVLKAKLSDSSFGSNPASLSAMASGSLNSYYQEVSYNQELMNATIINTIYNLTQTESYYASGGNIIQLINETVIQANASVVSLGGYSIFRHIVIIHSGTDKAVTHTLTDISSEFVYNLGGSPLINRSHIRIQNACIVAQADPLGVVAHEVGHSLGLPDLYDITYSGSGSIDPPFVGRWDLMGAGSWSPYDPLGFSLPTGTSPAHPSTWCKIKLGWIKPGQIVSITQTAIHVSGSNVIVYLKPEEANESTLAIRIVLDNGTYLLVENRQQIGYDAALPSRGILILYCDDSIPSGYGPVIIRSANPPGYGAFAAFNVGGFVSNNFFGDRSADIGVKILNKWVNGTYKILVGDYDYVFNTPTEYMDPAIPLILFIAVFAVVAIVTLVVYVKRGRQKTQKSTYGDITTIKLS
ncbi:MAG: M6 family metalloprotease domain-containing protein [Candidatus Atabeyarchaeum deiterrae]